MLQGQLQSRVEAELDLATNEAEEHALGYAMLVRHTTWAGPRQPVAAACSAPWSSAA
jgi:hypothetical protein